MAFHALANLAELHNGYFNSLKVEGRNVILIQEHDKHYIIEDRCPHMDAPLRTGRVAEGAIICRAHGIGFSLESGKPQGPLAGMLDCLTAFPVIYEGTKIGLEL